MFFRLDLEYNARAGLWWIAVAAPQDNFADQLLGRDGADGHTVGADRITILFST
jgi:hypothetical protein